MIKKLSIKNVRIFKDKSFEFKKNIVIFIGDNALGKTTIIESIYFLCVLHSFRSNYDSDLIRFESEYGKITGLIDREYMVAFTKDGKKAFVNKNEVKTLKDYIGLNNVVIFSPNDLNLVYGSPVIRRKFLNVNIGQISKAYLNVLSEYNKILKERNEMLKNKEINSVLLDVLTNSLIEKAKVIIKFRYEFIKDLNDYLVSIGNEKIVIEYNPSVSYKNIDEDFKNSLDYDINTKTTNKGPHRDDFKIKVDDLVSNYISQGQARTASLALKLTLINIIKKYKNKNPIVLLDDVLSELDKSRKNKLLSIIDDNCQIFITSTDVSNIDSNLLNKAQIIELKKEE